MSRNLTEIYIVTAGCYSDYHIEFVTDDKTFAERLMMLLGPSSSGYRIEEYNLIRAEDHDLEEAAQKITGKPIFIVSMKKDGEVTLCREDEHSWSHEDAALSAILGNYEEDISPSHPGPEYPGHKYDYFTIRVFARDKKHAIKITNEIRTRLIAEGKWPESEKE